MKKRILSISLLIGLIIVFFLTATLALAKEEEPAVNLAIEDAFIPLRQAITQTTVFEANLSGAKEVGPVDTLASGRAVLAISGTATNTLFYRVLVNDITGVTAAHIHQGAVGTNGPVIFTLFNGTGTFDAAHPISGTLTLTPTQITDLLTGNYYVNVHTSANSGGEIRGQVAKYTPPANFNALLSGAKEIPAVNSSALGVSRFTLSSNLSVLSYTLAVTNITNVTAAHIHVGPSTENGPVIVTLDSGTLSPSNPVSGTAAMTSAKRLVDLLTNFNYVNVHTSANPNGEIRGQIGGASVFRANLSGANEVPTVTTTASGRAVLGLSDDATSLYYRVLVQNISGVSAAHIHRGAAGVNGPVIFTLFNGSGTFDPTHPVSGTVTLSNNDVFDLLGNNFYVNVHTTANPNGEIRGQVGAYTPPTFFSAQLTGANEVPPVTTTASGQGRFTLTDLNILHFFVKVANISNITAAHIHKGAVGQNGPVIHFLYNGSGVFDPANPVGDGVRLTAENLVDLLTDYYYVNVHTSVNAGGEIRGQISGPRIYLPLVVKN